MFQTTKEYVGFSAEVDTKEIHFLLELVRKACYNQLFFAAIVVLS